MSMHDYRPLTKMDFSTPIDVSFPTNGTAQYVPYSTVESRIRSFGDAQEVIGRDTTNTYNIYKIELGTKGKPIIMLMSGNHGTEYQGCLYNIGIMEDLRDNNFPVPGFRDEILNNFHVICIPVVNPWGHNYTTPYAILRGRHNSNDVDLNRDYQRFTEQETRVVRPYMDNPNIFAFADNHLIRNHSRDGVVFVGHGQDATRDLRDHIVKSMNTDLSRLTEPWEAFVNMTWGITRRYMRDKMNNHTAFTLSYTIELARPVDETAYPIQRPFSNDAELYEYGYKVTYLFLRTAMDYYYAYKGTGEYGGNDSESELNKVVMPHKEITFVRNSEGVITKALEKFTQGKDAGKTLETDILRNSKGYVEKLNRIMKG